MAKTIIIIILAVFIALLFIGNFCLGDDLREARFNTGTLTHLLTHFDDDTDWKTFKVDTREGKKNFLIVGLPENFDTVKFNGKKLLVKFINYDWKEKP